MSCEGNRKRFFDVLQARCGLGAATLEKVYQAGRNQPRDPDEATEKTRLLFDDLRLLGLKPPTHSPDGLPNAAARQGYAAVFDYIRSHVHGDILDWEDLGLKKPAHYPYDWKNWPLEITPVALLDGKNEKNAAGRAHHRYLDNGKHVWWGERQKQPGDVPYAPTPDREITPEEKRAVDDFLSRRDSRGFYPDGRDEFGFDPDGWDELGYNLYGLHRSEVGYSDRVKHLAALKISTTVQKLSGNGNPINRSYTLDIEGFDEDGFAPFPEKTKWDDVDRFGFNRLGFRQGRSWTGYDENGLDENGNPYPKRKGYDAWGYEKKTGLTAPDAQGRRYNLIGWVYDPQTDECYNPDNPQQRMKHSGSFSYSSKWKKVVLKRSYVPSEQEMADRIRNPSIRMDEIAGGGFRGFVYGVALRNRSLAEDREMRMRRIWWHLPEVRALRSQEIVQANPEASFMGVRLRCPRCGRFTGVEPHDCPSFGKKVLVYEDGMVVALEKGSIMERIKAPKNSIFSPRDVIDEIVVQSHLGRIFWCGSILNEDPVSAWAGVKTEAMERFDSPEMAFNRADNIEVRPGDLLRLLWKQGGETGIVIEAPYSPLGDDFDPDYDGSPLSGLHWKTGLTRDGYTPSGIHYLTGRTRDGKSIESLKKLARIKTMLGEAAGEDFSSDRFRSLLERTYSRIATSIAGEPRRVVIERQGGPRPGMFWTDMQGRIQAEMEPLRFTPNHSDENNFLALKAGIYHELGHEEDTPVGIFRRIIDIAQGKERVDGIPPKQAGIVSEIYNILEDGRMERSQARRRRGVANILAADALINPRWDEKVGEEVPVMHQIMGLMLYRSLPFFRVRREVLDRAPERVRRLYAEIEPLVDAAMRSPEDAFRASIEIARRLTKDPEIAQEATRITNGKTSNGEWARSGGGGYAVIVSALPRPKDGGEADNTLSIPTPGWNGEEDGGGGWQSAGRSDEDDQKGRQSAGKTEEEPRTGRQGAGRSDEDDQKGRQSAGKTEDEPRTGRQSAGKTEEEAHGRGAGSSTGSTTIAPEPDQAFLDGLLDSLDIGEALSSVLSDIETGTRVTSNVAGEKMQQPLRPEGILLPTEEGVTQIGPLTSPSLTPKRKRELNRIVQAAEREARPLAQRLQRLRTAILKRERFQPSGRADRKRFKRAISGSKNVYQNKIETDVTSLAVSIQVDMSGSMRAHVRTGKLASTAATIGKAMELLGAQYAISAFGGETKVVKTFGDPTIREEQLYGLMSNDLGGTSARDGLLLGLHGLKKAKASNKLHFLLTDGSLFDHNKSKKVIADMRANGIIPFGIFFGTCRPGEADSMNDLFGEGNWANIQQLSDLSNVVAKRIEIIYRRILATRS